MSGWAWVGVAVLGGVGANARFLVHTLVSARVGGELPIATLLGLLAGVSLSGDALVLAGSATLGSYTTFSTWMLETELLAGKGRRGAALLNVLVSVAVGMGAVALGRGIAGG